MRRRAASLPSPPSIKPAVPPSSRAKGFKSPNRCPTVDGISIERLPPTSTRGTQRVRQVGIPARAIPSVFSRSSDASVATATGDDTSRVGESDILYDRYGTGRRYAEQYGVDKLEKLVKSEATAGL